MRIAALVLLVLGLVALGLGSFSHVREKDEIKLGPIEIQVTEKEQVELPLWAGVGAVVLGALLLVAQKSSISR
jgi:hypothetical protein